ncbi:Dam family site-specific DNA-(adenine-N6)-methyltransferase [Nitrososphaera sp.]|uniref:DNA adenine methylase n=1 Tax=Nitrososphaera sp. TaxID=1971748 RepID=UPI00182A346B|nr:Dam family site-specific DNA-(adenine-N6)-methyltransferase [Nitrososphaera sp.]NWG37258.1 Dam family site-specific DNA-(adenine-N6)-methyltransferase [Nitrososphaera sp.]
MGGITWPFLKWACGKRRLARHLAALCPDRFERYIEPFLGSGALFLYLAQTRQPFPALLSDSNAELVNVYRCVRDSVNELAQALEEHERRYYRNPEGHYYRVRDDCRPQDRIERAARMIFLNKTCYNGLYRVNRAGRFNVPHGTYVRPAICNKEALMSASEILNRDGVSIRRADYSSAISACRPGDLVYLDPPYLPITKTASFTDYTSESFGYDDHVALAKEFQRLSDLGCTVVLSNSNSVRIRRLYEGFAIQTVGVSRSINCNASRRTGQSELVVTNAQVIRRQLLSGRQALPASAPRTS